jgi:hypothetical protein
MQNVEFPLAPGMLGVAEAALAVRFTSTEHGVEVDPQVLAGVHSEAGSASEQAYLLLFCACAVARAVSKTRGSKQEVNEIA